jgi:ADP-ribose pyrophosphatase YjhB (NUDIX family)
MSDIFYDHADRPIAMPADRKAVPRTSVYGVSWMDERILLVRPEWSEMWELPGGRIDPGEDWRAAVGRELIEETGYDAVWIDKEPFMKQQQNFFAEGYEEEFFLSTKLFVALKRSKERDASRMLPDEIVEIGEFDLRQMKVLKVRSAHLEAIEAYLAGVMT